MRKISAALVASVAGVALLSGCSDASTSSDMIAFVAGDGQNGNDAKIHKVVYPNQEAKAGGGERVSYIPAGSRNYVIDAREGVDRKEPAEGRTKTGTPVKVYLSAYWTVNQDKDILVNKFVPFCNKYLCAQADPNERGELSSTPGWLNMLNENMGPAIDDSVRTVMPQFEDNVWKTQEDWDKVAAAVSTEFTKKMRVRSGYTDDLFCGSGDSSGWDNPDKPGEGTFKCGPVTFAISYIGSMDATQQDAANKGTAAETLKETNAKILEAAIAKYGSKEEAGRALANLDVIEACKAAGLHCVVSVNGAQVVTSAPSGDTEPKK